MCRNEEEAVSSKKNTVLAAETALSRTRIHLKSLRFSLRVSYHIVVWIIEFTNFFKTY